MKLLQMSLLRLQPMPVLCTWQISDDKTEKDNLVSDVQAEPISYISQNEVSQNIMIPLNSFPMF